MIPEQYDENISATKDLTEWKFVSTGTKGDVTKHIKFDLYESLGESNVFNCGFGELNEDGTFNDSVKSYNGDMDKVLGTVAFTILEFFKLYPKSGVYLTGSCPVRTRKYRIVISNNLDEIKNHFVMYGHFKNADLTLVFETFRIGVEYEGFLLRKLVKDI